MQLLKISLLQKMKGMKNVYNMCTNFEEEPEAPFPRGQNETDHI